MCVCVREKERERERARERERSIMAFKMVTINIQNHFSESLNGSTFYILQMERYTYTLLAVL